MTPSLCIACIAKNEERDLPRMLRSVVQIARKIVLVDTGSTDKTLEVAAGIADDKLVTDFYVDASEQVDGQWRLKDFSKARNRALDLADALECTHVLMLDADDELLTPAAVYRAIYWDQMDAFGVWIQDGNTRWITHRLWKTKRGIRYEGRCHEYPILNGQKIANVNDIVILHRGTPGENQENSNARNLRMLMGSWEEDGPQPRTAFYIANTHRDGGRLAEAVEWYRKRIEFGEGYRDEYLFAYLYMARCLRGQNLEEIASAILREAHGKAPDWCEFVMELAQQRYDHQLFEQAIEFARPCVSRNIPYTDLWREHNAYRDRPARLISWCYEHMGKMNDALMWSAIAKGKIGKEDKEWDARHARLEKQVLASKVTGPPAILTGVKPKFALVRPGAIGDILITLNLIPAFKKAHPEAEIHYFCAAQYAAPNALGTIIKQAGVDQVCECPPRHAGDDYFDDYERMIDLIGYPINQGYPDRPMTQHLIQYFATEMGLDPMADYTLTLPRPEPIEGWSPYITVQTDAGWSKYKEWDKNRWASIRKEMLGVRFLTIGASAGKTIAQSMSVFANARMHIGIDSFCNHLTHYLWTDDDMETHRVPGVILFGSTSPTGSGYEHNTNIYRGLHCQPCYREDPKISRHPRGPCVRVVDYPSQLVGRAESYDDPRPHECMDLIEVNEVVQAVKDMWEKVK